jgi:hypothetical protein
MYVRMYAMVVLYNKLENTYKYVCVHVCMYVHARMYVCSMYAHVPYLFCMCMFV